MATRLNTSYTDPEIKDILGIIDEFNIITGVKCADRAFPEEVKQGPFRLTFSLQNPRAEFLILHDSSHQETLNESLIEDLVKISNSF